MVIAKPFKKIVFTLDSIRRCIVDRLNIDKQVSEDWPTWSYAGLEGHRREYLKRNNLRLAQITRELLKQGVTQQSIDDVVTSTTNEANHEK